MVKVYSKIDLTVDFDHEHFIDPTNRPWVSEDGFPSEFDLLGLELCLKPREKSFSFLRRWVA